jgi:hypothetical protein
VLAEAERRSAQVPSRNRINKPTHSRRNITKILDSRRPELL